MVDRHRQRAVAEARLGHFREAALRAHESGLGPTSIDYAWQRVPSRATIVFAFAAASIACLGLVVTVPRAIVVPAVVTARPEHGRELVVKTAMPLREGDVYVFDGKSNVVARAERRDGVQVLVFPSRAPESKSLNISVTTGSERLATAGFRYLLGT